ncbi:MarR family winged helix-turn-helix transcriptional regulator [Streptomyces sp. CBMA29]|uniref:MarR family winged helix-turn-helix transcriptional regulator n=1 Tax=Streptomyces sp. CBMA29 TaxID=1896314 RepID=UPI001661C6B2|nr:MarR family transcriptional regulator [Streptomyces sp. CBMA29]
MASLPVLNQPPRRSGALLEQLTRRMRLHAESVLTPLGLRPRHLVALTVLRDQHGSTQQALSTTLMMDRANVVGLLNDLETDGLIERLRSPEDRRRHLVQLTDEGGKRLAKAEFALARVEDEVLCALDTGQRDTLYDLLQLAASGHGVDGTAADAALSCVTDAPAATPECLGEAEDTETC